MAFDGLNAPLAEAIVAANPSSLEQVDCPAPPSFPSLQPISSTEEMSQDTIGYDSPKIEELLAGAAQGAEAGDGRMDDPGREPGNDLDPVFHRAEHHNSD